MSIKKFFRQEVIDLPAYHLEVHSGAKLNQNESPWDIPVDIKADIVEQMLKTPWNRYPLDDVLHLQKKMAKYLGVWPDNIVFANGSNVLIQALVFATSISREVMVVDPTFSVYEIEAQLFSNKIIRVPLNPDFSIPVDRFIKEMKKQKPGIIFLANPNSPTATLFDKEGLRKIIDAAECLVVIDEAYYPFSGVTLMDWVKECDNLVILRTFSKAFALGGLRLGWMIAEPEVCRQVQKCLLPFCISRLSSLTAMGVLENPQYIDLYVKQICAERDRVYSILFTLSGITVHPTHTNFILFEVEDSPSIFKQLLIEGVIVRQVNDGRRLKNALRVSIGSPKENDAFLQAIEKVLS